jgi:ribosome-binding factor A
MHYFEPKIPSKGEASQRQRRVGEVIREAVATIMQEGKGFSSELVMQFVTVTRVTISADLRNATIYVSSLMIAAASDASDVAQKQDLLLRLVQEHAPAIRAQMTPAVNLRYSPELLFRVDKELDATLSQKAQHPSYA